MIPYPNRTCTDHAMSMTLTAVEINLRGYVQYNRIEKYQLARGCWATLVGIDKCVFTDYGIRRLLDNEIHTDKPTEIICQQAAAIAYPQCYDPVRYSKPEVANDPPVEPPVEWIRV